LSIQIKTKQKMNLEKKILVWKKKIEKYYQANMSKIFLSEGIFF